MTVYAAPDLVHGLDDELYKVGRPVVGRVIYAILDHVHHQFCWVRKAHFGWSAQWGLGEIGTPTRGVTASEDYEWRYTSGLNSRFLNVTAVTVGKVTGGSNDSGLTVATTTTAAQTFAQVPQSAALGADPDTGLFQEHRWVIPITANNGETVAIDQLITAECVRIVALNVEELPVSVIDTAVDAWAGVLDQYAPALDIVEGAAGASGGAAVPPAASSNVATLPVLCQTLRRFHKQVIFSSAQQVSTAVVGVANRVDLFTKQVPATRMRQWDLPESVTRPESASRSITCRVLAKSSAAGGIVRFHFGGGVDIDVAVAAGASAWTQATGSPGKTGETVSVQGYQNGAGTLTLFNAIVEEDIEAT